MNEFQTQQKPHYTGIKNENNYHLPMTEFPTLVSTEVHKMLA